MVSLLLFLDQSDLIVERLGTLITTLDEISYYKFPELNQLEKATEEELKELGFGYRARYIVASVKQVGISYHENFLIWQFNTG